jgi:hypothetical protein
MEQNTISSAGENNGGGNYPSGSMTTKMAWYACYTVEQQIPMSFSLVLSDPESAIFCILGEYTNNYTIFAFIP